jgi:hypothetical protein
MDANDRNQGEYYFIRVNVTDVPGRRFLIRVIFSSREEAEASLKAEYARHEEYGYTHEVLHVSEVTQQELDLTIRLIRQSVPRPVDTLFLAFWEGRAPIPMDPILTAIYAVASGALQPDLAVEEIRRHYGIPVAVASPQSDRLN